METNLPKVEGYEETIGIGTERHKTVPPLLLGYPRRSLHSLLDKILEIWRGFEVSHVLYMLWNVRGLGNFHHSLSSHWTYSLCSL